MIKLKPSRSVSNLTSFDRGITEIPTALVVEAYKQLNHNENYRVAKVGRTSTWTSGRINAITSYLKLRSERHRSSIIPIEFKEDEGRWDDVVLAVGIISDHDRTEFLEGGDSGSVVLLNEKDAEKKARAMTVSLGFAWNDKTWVSYMTPMSLVFRNIKDVTGTTVVTPIAGGTAERKWA
jgi:hypothetical protein